MKTVTFDTNTLRPLVESTKRTDANRIAFEKIETAIASGLVQPFASDTIINLEGQPRSNRQSHWGGLTNVVKHEDKGLQTQKDGSEAYERKITITPTFPANQIPEPLRNAIQAAFIMGVKFIKVPRVGMPMLPKNMYEDVPNEKELGAVLDRCCEAIKAFEARGCGSDHIVEMAKEKTLNDQSLASKGMMAFAAEGGKNAIAEALAEWSDGDSLAAHYGYQHNYFCTMDEGKGAGAKSILHLSHRSWLKEQFNIEIVSPEKLAVIIEKG